MDLLSKAQLLPTTPGCYLMRGVGGDVLYVGKAKNLRARVITYFGTDHDSLKTAHLVQQIADFDFFLTTSEVEALILENNLIKKHRPKYNIRLRDDKNYPYVLITHTLPFARLTYEHRRKDHRTNHDLIGPFTLGCNLHEVLRILSDRLQLRKCGDMEFKSRKHPCLYHQMHKCSAPCVGLIELERYQQQVALARDFLEGSSSRIVDTILYDEMMNLAQLHAYEEAAIRRDEIDFLRRFYDLFTHQRVELPQLNLNWDLLAIVHSEEVIDGVIYSFRQGILIERSHFCSQPGEELWPLEAPLSDVVSALILGHYERKCEDPAFVLPDRMITEALKGDEAQLLLQQALQQLARQTGRPQMIQICQKKSDPLAQRFLRLAKLQAMEEQRVRGRIRPSRDAVALDQLQEFLHLAQRPRRIEGFDVAVWQGDSPTAAQVVLVEGKVAKEHYRHYHLQSLSELNNDYRMMEELIRRRLTHGDLPDLFVIDGGKGQVNVVTKILWELGIAIPVVGVAKDRVKQGEHTRYRLILSQRKNPIYLDKWPVLQKLLVHLMDEAHRFCRRLHHRQEERRLLESSLLQIPGVGKKKAEAILKWASSIDSNSKIEVSEIQKQFALNELSAQAVANWFQQRTTT